jgi:hypothetical protein
MILNSLINNTKQSKKNQELHIVFLDVTKAYDKAWRNAQERSERKKPGE